MPRSEQRQPKSRIRDLRIERHLSQKDLAEQWDVTINTVRSWESRPKAVYTLIRLVQLCEILSCSPRDLVIVAEPSSQEAKHKTRQEIAQALRTTSSKLEKPYQEIRVAKLRKDQKLTQQDIAEALEVSLATIQNWENGRTGRQQLPKFIKLCEILNCKHTDLLDFIPPLKRTGEKTLSEIQQSINKKISNKTNSEFPAKPSSQLEAIEEK